MEVLLEEKSRKSEESVVITDSSGSGADIEGEGNEAYDIQKKGKRLGMFRQMQEAGNVNSKEQFDEFQDDDTDYEESQKAKEKFMKNIAQ
jgi:hypothetical protein